MKIDLRSDTVTQPTSGMLEAMMSAEVGDDVFEQDPTINALQQKMADLFKMDAGLFCPSGTMTNQIAIRIHTQPQDEAICHEYAHVYRYEGGGMMSTSGVSPKLLPGDRGRITANDIRAALNPDDIHYPVSRLVCLENTMNKGGGSIYALEAIREIRSPTPGTGLALHLDGARIFNALVETGQSPAEHGAQFDTISVCFSKGLGAPVGSILLGSHEHIRKARRVRKVLGGGMRQAGYLAAACIYAIDHQVNRLKEDHQRAREIGQALEKLPFISEIMPIETNIVIARLSGKKPDEFLFQLMSNHIYAIPFGPDLVRFVTHLDFDDDQLQRFMEVLTRMGA